MPGTGYADGYRGIDFRTHPEKYRVGRGEQGVLIAEPYKSEILPHWRFRTPEIATKSAREIYGLFLAYLRKKDFVGADMARKFLQMGFTRSRRYANHAGGKKYESNPQKASAEEAAALRATPLPQLEDWQTSEKAESARIFHRYYEKAKENERYQALMTTHKEKFENDPIRDDS